MTPRIATRLIAVFCLSLFSGSLFAADPATTAPAKPSIAKSAYSRVAPYVNADTLLVARIDFDSVDAEKIGATFSDVFNSVMLERGFTKDSRNNANREFKKSLAVLKERGFLYQLPAKSGVREVYFIMQKQAPSFRIYIPLAKSAQAELLPVVKEFFANWTVFEVEKGLCVTADQAADAEIYRKFKPGENPTLKKFFADTAGSTVQIYLAGLKFKGIAKAVPAEKAQKAVEEFFEDLPEETRKGFNSFDAGFRYGLLSYDLNTMTLKETLYFTTAERAEDFRVGLLKAIDKGASVISERAVANLEGDAKENVERYNMGPMAKEFIRGVAYSFVPTRQNAMLQFESTPQTKQSLANANYLMAYIFWTVFALSQE